MKIIVTGASGMYVSLPRPSRETFSFRFKIVVWWWLDRDDDGGGGGWMDGDQVHEIDVLIWGDL